jgi:Tol biopolymer transport system component
MRPIAATATSLLCAAALALPSPGHAAFPGRNGAVVFAQTVFETPGGAQSASIVSRPATHRGLVTLASCDPRSPTRCPLHDPAVSPDGQQIAYVAPDRDTASVARNSLFVAQVDGSNVREVPVQGLPTVSGSQVIAEQPAWSPDGGQLVFTSRLIEPGYPQRFVTRLGEINIDGSYPRRGLCEGSQPAWSIEARQRGANIPISLLAFSYRGNVWIARAADCGRRRQLTFDGGSQPNWAPDAKRLAFVRDGEIYRVGVDGGGLRRLTRHGGTAPAWSPDGKRIAFIRNGSLYVMTTGGRILRRLYTASHIGSSDVGTEALAADPDWQPIH